MSESNLIWRFTPSRTDPKLLEAIFVQRHDLLANLMERVSESAVTGNKHQMLLIGPRGFGKTHLVSLIQYRISQTSELGNSLRIAWLNEDETTTSFLQLLLRIYRALAETYPGEFSSGLLENLFDLPLPEAERVLKTELIEKFIDKTLLLIVENLHLLFEGLGDIGQKQWRAFLQEHPITCTIGTSQQLFAGISRRQNPFFGFFDAIHLKPLSIQEAGELLLNIAEQDKQKEDLQAFIPTPEGRSRVRALHHLAGGNHRVYIVLSDFITRESLDELVGPFEKMLDELTPYYQERLRALSPQQRQIVEFLCTRTAPCPAKTIARHLFAAENTIGSQLKKLRDLGYLTSATRGRESLYELTEPLMRLSYEVKENRREPMRLIVDFLRVWYRPDELTERLRQTSSSSLRAHLSAAIDQGKRSTDLRLKVIQNAVEVAKQENRLGKAIEALEEKAYLTNDANDWFDLAYYFEEATQHEEAIVSYEKSLKINPRNDIAWINKGFSLNKLGKYEEAIKCCNKSIEINPNNDSAWNNKGFALNRLGKYKEAIECYNKSIEINPHSINIEFLRCNSIFSLNQWENGFTVLRQAFEKCTSTPLDNTSYILNTIYHYTDNLETMQKHVRELISIYAAYNHLPRLGDGLVRSLSEIDTELLSEKKLYEWKDTWIKEGTEHSKLEIPLRIFKVGIDYLATQDERVLLDLIETERSILRQALELEPES